MSILGIATTRVLFSGIDIFKIIICIIVIFSAFLFVFITIRLRCPCSLRRLSHRRLL